MPVSTESALGTVASDGLVSVTTAFAFAFPSSAKVEGAFTIENNAPAQASVTSVFFDVIRKSPFSLFKIVTNNKI